MEVPWNSTTRGQRVAADNKPVRDGTLYEYKWRQPVGTPDVIDDPLPLEERRLKVRAGIMAYGYSSNSLDLLAGCYNTITVIIDNGVYANHSFSRAMDKDNGQWVLVLANELFNLFLGFYDHGFGQVVEVTTYQFNCTSYFREAMQEELNITIKCPLGEADLFTEEEKRSVLPCRDVLAANCLWCIRNGHASASH